ncbi:MAG: hypothetical protein N2Z71_01720 [Caloramator sp.]|nr:hypothetical protein [Caloramator sp.]
MLTDNYLQKLVANRTIIEGEMAARDFNCTLKVKDINLNLTENTTERRTYDFTVKLNVKYSDGIEKEVFQTGVIKLIKLENKWKVDGFIIRDGELYKMVSR